MGRCDEREFVLMVRLLKNFLKARFLSAIQDATRTRALRIHRLTLGT